jgi:acetylornithine deacetylase/succinyl-diaminopimelate desuccinylase-like protein
MRTRAWLVLGGVLWGASLHAAETPDFAKAAEGARKTLEQLVSLDTSNPPGNEARVTAWVAERLHDAGIPYVETEFAPGRKNLVARLKGGDSQLKPVMVVAHTDVVGAANQAWSTDPHRVTEKDGYLYGRGVSDDLGMVAVGLETLLLLKRSGIPLKRDVILALTGDEESSGTGIRHQLKQEPASMDAALALNEGGGLELGKDGQVQMVTIQMAEKTYVDFKLRTTGPTGHSSVPQKGNAIYKLSAALAKLGSYQDPARLTDVTRAYFAARAGIETGELARAMKAVASSHGKLPPAALKLLEADASLAAKLRTTCVATLLSGGTRVNALPSDATANVNCRVLPDESVEDVKARLKKVIADPSVEIEGSGDGQAGPSPVSGEGPEAIAKVARAMWPGVAIVPSLSGGATDSRWLRAKGVAAYGMNPIAMLEEDAKRMHGIDERIRTASLKPAVEFLYRLMLELAAARG